MSGAMEQGGMEIVVVGAHMSGLPLNGELLALNARFLRAARTRDCYRLYRLRGGPPFRPGLLRVAPGAGHAIAVEVWSVPLPCIGALLAAIPAPLGLGTLLLEDGTAPKGFLAEAEGVRDAEDISFSGGWRAWLASQGTALA
ncbi:amidase [Roseomonas sp. GC11]|uniref:allophanate hydrolase-related protein n=1 Tax=Roseomonas sp. GC11 TaxID=2950546 RepID=UPI00210D6DC5|nr:amidase [Roseomonas sp. GC11]MCQ4162374.1 amidase [Roseomonas sp. GC11]